MFEQPGRIVKIAEAVPPLREIGDAETQVWSPGCSPGAFVVWEVPPFDSDVPVLTPPLSFDAVSVDDEDDGSSEGAAAASVLAGCVEAVSVEPDAAPDPGELSVAVLWPLAASSDEVPSELDAVGVAWAEDVSAAVGAVDVSAAAG
jgi:hypothetical protein